MRRATIEIDLVAGCQLPPQSVIHGGQKFTLESVFSNAGIELEVKRSQVDLLPPARPFDRAMLHHYMTKYRNRRRQGWHGHI